MKRLRACLARIRKSQGEINARQKSIVQHALGLATQPPSRCNNSYEKLLMEVQQVAGLEMSLLCGIGLAGSRLNMESLLVGRLPDKIKAKTSWNCFLLQRLVRDHYLCSYHKVSDLHADVTHRLQQTVRQVNSDLFRRIEQHGHRFQTRREWAVSTMTVAKSKLHPALQTICRIQTIFFGCRTPLLVRASKNARSGFNRPRWPLELSAMCDYWIPEIDTLS